MFSDRRDAGRRLATKLRRCRDDLPVVLGLPRGGVPVAREVARELAAPLDVIVVRKLGVPSHPELAMGAIGEGGVRVLQRATVDAAGVEQDEIDAITAGERRELDRRTHIYRGDRARVDLAGRLVIVVDDGVATGSTATAACQVARLRGATTVVFATPVGSDTAVRRLRSAADKVVCLESPAQFAAVSQWYEDFHATSDDEVVRALRSPWDRVGDRARRGG